MILAGSGLTAGGWVFMLSSLGVVVAVVVFFYSRLLRKQMDK